MRPGGSMIILLCAASLAAARDFLGRPLAAARGYAGGAVPSYTRRPVIAGHPIERGGSVEGMAIRLEALTTVPSELTTVPDEYQRIVHPIEQIVDFAEEEADRAERARRSG